MFGTLRSLAARAKAALALVVGAATLPQNPGYNGPAIPVRSRLMRALDQRRGRAFVLHANGGRKQRTQGTRDHSLHERSNRVKAARKAHARRAASFLLFAGLWMAKPGVIHAQTVTVSASNLYDGSSPANGTITFAPVLSNGQAASYRYPGGGQRTVGVYSATVTNGAFTITLPDTSQTSPVNLCFNVVLTGTRNRLGAGYSCVQPAASNSWCTAGVCNFDNYTPNESPLVLSQAGPTGPQGPQGPAGPDISGLASDGANGISVQGAVNTGSVNGALNAGACANTSKPSWCAGTDMGAWLNAAIQHLPAAPVGGEVDIPTLSTGCWTISTEVVIDRPVTIHGQNWTFNSNGGTCLTWSGGGTPVFEINGASRASSNSILENFSLTNSTSGTIGIDINGGQYNVIVRNVSIAGGAVRFATAGVQVGNDSAPYPDGDVTLENVRIGYQTTGLNVVYANTIACISCHIYSNNVANVHLGDSGHIVFDAIFTGGDIEQDDTNAPSFLLANVISLNLNGVYSELAAAAQSVISLSSDCAHVWDIFWNGGYLNMNGFAGSLLNTNQTCSFSGASFTLSNVSVANPSSGASIVNNPVYSAPSGIRLRDITSDSSAIVVSNTSDAYMRLDNVLGTSASMLDDTGTVCWENYAGTGQSCLRQNTGYNLEYTWGIYAGAGLGPNFAAPGVTWTEGSGAPTGTCGSGALYTNTAGTSGGSDNLYVCSQSAWVAVK